MESFYVTIAASLFFNFALFLASLAEAKGLDRNHWQESITSGFARRENLKENEKAHYNKMNSF